MLQKNYALNQTVRALGSGLLSALEKNDAEAMGLLAQHRYHRHVAERRGGALVDGAAALYGGQPIVSMAYGDGITPGRWEVAVPTDRMAFPQTGLRTSS